MHSPTLVAIAAILMLVMTLMLAAAWRFNPRIAGLGAWTLSYCSGLLVCLSLLLRAVAPELLLVLLTQLSAYLMAWLNWAGTRAYVGATPLPRRYGVLGGGMLLAAAAWFTVPHPDQAMRFTLLSLVMGVLFLLCAHTIARGRLQEHPARYLYALASGGHGLFLLLRPWLFHADSRALFDAGHAIAVSHLMVVEAIVAIVLMAFGIVMLANERVTLELRRLAERDPLTGVFNRRAFLTLLDKGSHYAERMAFPLSVLQIDLDHFKRINDRWGHQAGDRALCHFVTVAQACLRDGDVIGRLGGEEFAVFLPNARLAQAEAIADRLCRALEMQPLPHSDTRIELTASIGVAQRQPHEETQTLLHRADEAMYLAKQRGRNRIELAAQPPVPAGIVAATVQP